MLYLAPYVGGGTRKDPFRPIGSDQPGWSAIDLRADGGITRDGAGFPYALLWLPVGAVVDPSLIKLADGKDELLAVSARTQLATKSLLDLSSCVTLSDALELLLIHPKANAWNPITPVKGVYEAWLGSDVGKVRWVAKPAIAIAGGSISDTFTRANETPVAAPWTTLAGSSGGNVNLTSNALTRVTTTGDSFRYYNNAGGWNADHSSEFTDATGVTNDDWGPAVRVGSNGFSGYLFSQFNSSGSREISKFVAGTFTSIEVAAGTTVRGQTQTISVVGSTITYSSNGSANANSPGTDTALTTAGNGAGFFMFDIGGSLDNFLATGEIASSQGPLTPSPQPTTRNKPGQQSPISRLYSQTQQGVTPPPPVGPPITPNDQSPFNHPGLGPLMRARFVARQQGILFPVVVITAVFRKTLSGIGSRTGSRQSHNDN